MKKFGKLRQWTDEKLGSSQKTIATEEFRDMEAEMHLRQQGLESVHQASLTWMKILGKQVKAEQEKEKGTPLDLLGIAMHGDEFAPESAYGQALSRFGVSQQRIARIQDKFQQTVNETVLLNMERSLAAMKEFQAARKKLESRRLTYDSALNKTQKAKKEDSKLEEELRAAKVRYEETSEDVQQRMLSIRDAEANNLRDILDFIEAEANYFDQARTVITQLRDDLQGDIAVSDGSTLCRDKSSVSFRCRASDIGTQGDSTEMPEPDCLTMHALINERNSNIPERDRRAFLPARRSQAPYDHADEPRRPPRNGSLASKATMTQVSRADSPADRAQPGRKVMLVKFSFEAEAENELSIRAGEYLEVLEEVSAGWWRGHIISGSSQDRLRSGLFPVNYCSVYPEADQVGAECRNIDKDVTSRPTSRIDIHANDLDLSHKSHTFPRNVRQASTAYELNAQNVRIRPPPPPIPKKKQSARH